MTVKELMFYPDISRCIKVTSDSLTANATQVVVNKNLISINLDDSLERMSQENPIRYEGECTNESQRTYLINVVSQGRFRVA